MATIIAKLNGTIPKGTNLEETVDDLVWNDEFEVRLFLYIFS